MNGLAILQQYNTQDLAACLWDSGPSTNSSIGLHILADWMGYGTLDPLLPDILAIFTATGMKKVRCEPQRLHLFFVPFPC